MCSEFAEVGVGCGLLVKPDHTEESGQWQVSGICEELHIQRKYALNLKIQGSTLHPAD